MRCAISWPSGVHLCRCRTETVHRVLGEAWCDVDQSIAGHFYKVCQSHKGHAAQDTATYLQRLLCQAPLYSYLALFSSSRSRGASCCRTNSVKPNMTTLIVSDRTSRQLALHLLAGNGSLQASSPRPFIQLTTAASERRPANAPFRYTMYRSTGPLPASTW